MFKRTIEMQVVKPAKSVKTESTSEVSRIDYTATAVTTIRETVRGAAILTATYVGADTLRRIAVHVIATKIN